MQRESADAGIVYATDAQTENTNGDDKEVEIVATAEDSMMQTPVIYPVGTVSSSAHKDEAKLLKISFRQMKQKQS